MHSYLEIDLKIIVRGFANTAPDL
jgi:hypothetical protein